MDDRFAKDHRRAVLAMDLNAVVRLLDDRRTFGSFSHTTSCKRNKRVESGC